MGDLINGIGLLVIYLKYVDSCKEAELKRLIRLSKYMYLQHDNDFFVITYQHRLANKYRSPHKYTITRVSYHLSYTRCLISFVYATHFMAVCSWSISIKGHRRKTHHSSLSVLFFVYTDYFPFMTAEYHSNPIGLSFWREGTIPVSLAQNSWLDATTRRDVRKWNVKKSSEPLEECP